MKIFSFWRSLATYRVRIALNLKGIVPDEVVEVNLMKGEQRADAFRAVNPMMAIPALVDGEGPAMFESLAIIEYLDETHPNPPLLPKDPIERARVRALAMAVGCDIHPIDNLRVLTYLQKVLQVSEGQFEDWYNHWIALGFRAVEGMLAGHPKTGTYMHGESPTLADVYLVPQVVNSFRFKLPLAPYPNLKRVFDNCMKHPAFDKALPKNQPDFEP